jgi:type I restriction enzyme R subunit
MVPGLYRQYSPDFFDLIIVDECHRGAQTKTAVGMKFCYSPAVQLGMTATYYGTITATVMFILKPLYTYSL